MMTKGLTSGHLPLGATIVSEHIARHFEDRTLWSGLTCSGHPMSCAAALATIRVYQEEGLLENAKQLESVMAEGLASLGDKHPSVG